MSRTVKIRTAVQVENIDRVSEFGLRVMDFMIEKLKAATPGPEVTHHAFKEDGSKYVDQLKREGAPDLCQPQVCVHSGSKFIAKAGSTAAAELDKSFNSSLMIQVGLSSSNARHFSLRPIAPRGNARVMLRHQIIRRGYQDLSSKMIVGPQGHNNVTEFGNQILAELNLEYEDSDDKVEIIPTISESFGVIPDDGPKKSMTRNRNAKEAEFHAGETYKVRWIFTFPKIGNIPKMCIGFGDTVLIKASGPASAFSPAPMQIYFDPIADPSAATASASAATASASAATASTSAATASTSAATASASAATASASAATASASAATASTSAATASTSAATAAASPATPGPSSGITVTPQASGGPSASTSVRRRIELDPEILRSPFLDWSDPETE